MKVGIIGGAGYTGGELIRLLIHHPKAKLASIVSESQAGKAVVAVHKDLLGETNLQFTSTLLEEVELIFLCMGHGRSEAFFQKHPEYLEKKIIDLSTDFRPRNNALQFTYGLPEINRKAIQTAQHLANPGCFATAIQLSLLPLATMKLLQDTIHIHGITGSTGAGQRPSTTTHFAWRDNNLSIYKLFQHQHLSEIKETLQHQQNGFEQQILFVPMRGPFSRGIFISAHTHCTQNLATVKAYYESYYEHHPFVHITDEDVSLKDVVNTNKCFIQLQKHGDTLHVSSVIDNLLKGASGQAVQNMNIMMEWPEKTGLALKATSF